MIFQFQKRWYPTGRKMGDSLPKTFFMTKSFIKSNNFIDFPKANSLINN